MGGSHFSLLTNYLHHLEAIIHFQESFILSPWRYLPWYSLVLGNWSITFSENPRNGIDIIYLLKKKHLTGSKNNVPLDKCTFDGNYVFTILLLKKKPHGVILRVKLYFLNHLDILKLIRGWKAYFAFYLHRMTLMSLKMRNYKAIIEVVFFFFVILYI
jgi:hypothetical protein